MKAGYVINVGHALPVKAIISVPNKDGNPSVDVAEVTKTVGTHLLINRGRVWARRVLNDGKPLVVSGEEQILEVTDPRYRGRLQFLEWGSAEVGAQAIDIRYLPQSASLDVEYQDNIQKVKLDAEGKDGSAFIELQSGQNKFDPKTQALLITFLQVMPQNRDSKSKRPDPQIKGYTYHEITDSTADSTAVKQAESQITAGSFVMGISTDVSKLRNLLTLFIDFGVDFGDVSLLSLDGDVYKALLNFAQTNPGDFGYYINERKKNISDLFEKAKTYKALDLTTAGTIAFINGNKKEILFSRIEGAKEDKMIDWVLENFLEADVSEKINHLQSLCDKLK